MNWSHATRMANSRGRNRTRPVGPPTYRRYEVEGYVGNRIVTAEVSALSYSDARRVACENLMFSTIKDVAALALT